MPRNWLLVAVLVCAAGATTISAQVIVTLGNTTVASNTYPFKYSALNGRYQTCYAASEINLPGGGSITEIWVHGAVGTATTYGGLRLRLAHTNLTPTTITANFNTNYTGTLATGLGPVNYSPATTPGTSTSFSWWHFVLTTPFLYNGTSNLIVDWSYDSRTGNGFNIATSGSRLRAYLNGGSYASATGGVTSSGDYGIRFTFTTGLTITTPSPLAEGIDGFTYNQTIQADYGVPGYSWTVGTGLPPGVIASTLGNDLILSGTPTTTGTYQFLVTVQDNDSPP
ncbi:MAG: hypothetical protein K8I27_03670, partial [Planctomycetes bacterium]|nr:hypothetical protein [Planctomycetota bacterium]